MAVPVLDALVWSKLGAIVLTFFIGIGAGALPLASPSFRENKTALSLANTFAAGVFLAMGVCHLLPEAAERMAAYRPDLNGRYPVAFLLFIGGYTVILAIDRVVFSTVHGHGHSHGHGPGPQDHGAKEPMDPFEKAPMITEPSEGHPNGPLAGYVLMVALSLHGASEGMALGLQDLMKEVVPLAIAIVAHKWAEALALGIAFASSKMDTHQAMTLVVVFAASTPAGIAIGMALNALLSPLAVACAMAMAAGSFLYIGASEVVVEEFVPGRSNWLRLVAFIGGIALMVLLKGVADYDPPEPLAPTGLLPRVPLVRG